MPSGNSTTLYTQTSNKTIANTTAATSLFTSGYGDTMIPANSMFAGRSFRLVIYGFFSTVAIAPTLAFSVKLGTTTLIAGSVSSLVGSLVQQAFSAVFTFTCRSIGAAGSIMGQGYLSYSNSTLLVLPTSTTNRTDLRLTTPVPIDTTVDNIFDCLAAWGTANVGNTLTVTNATLEALN